MKATQSNFSASAPRAARDCKLFFFCGPDEAGASAAAAKIIALLPAAGERVELSGAELKAEPARLIDEARSSSLFGSDRHLYIRAAGEEAFEAVRLFAEMTDIGQAEGACPVLIVATSATDKSRTAKLMETRGDALVAMFYPPDVRSVASEVRVMAGAAGLRGFDGALAERVAVAAGLDVRLAQSEITKLALYLDADPQSPCLVKAEDIDAIGASTGDDGIMPLVNAVLSGDLAALPAQLRRLREMSLNPVAVALALERRAAQLASLVPRLGRGGNIEAFLKAERVFFKDIPDLKAQLGCWNGAKLERLVPNLAQLHRSLLGDSQQAELFLAQALARIARFAAARRS